MTDKKAPETAPLSPLLLFLSSNKSLKTISTELSIDYPSLVRQAKREQWETVREQYRSAVRKKAVERAIDVDFRQIQALRDSERSHIAEAIDQLEAFRRSLHIGDHSPADDSGKRKGKDDSQLTIERLGKYAEARQTLQKMLYRSYGIEQNEGSGSKTALIFNNYPQAGDVVRRYAADIETPPHGQNTPPTPTPHTTHTDVIQSKSESLPVSPELSDSVMLPDSEGIMRQFRVTDDPELLVCDDTESHNLGDSDEIEAIMMECTGYREIERDEGRVPEGLGVKKGVSFTAPEVRKKLYPRAEVRERPHKTYEPLVDFDD